MQKFIGDANNATFSDTPSGVVERNGDTTIYHSGAANLYSASSPAPTNTVPADRIGSVPSYSGYTPATTSPTSGPDLALFGTASSAVGGAAPTTSPDGNSQGQGIQNAQGGSGSSGILDYLKSLIGVESTKGDYTERARADQDFYAKQNAVNDINKRILATESSYNNMLTAAQNNVGGAYGSMAGVNDAISDITRKRNQDIANLSIIKSAAVGDLETATNIIAQKVDAHFAPVEANIKNLESLYQLSQNDMSEKEKLQAQLAIDAKKERASVLKNISADIYKNLADNGAPQSVFQAVDSAMNDPKATPATLYAAAGKYAAGKIGPLSVPSANEYSPIIVSSIKDKNAGMPQFGGLSYNGLLNSAKVALANNMKVPSLGLGQAKDVKAARMAVINYAGQLADDLGMTADQISALYKANSKAAGAIVERVARVESISGALTSQLPRIAQLADKVKSLGITESDLQSGVAAVKRKFGSQDAANYVELINTVRGDYAGMQAALAGGRGGQYFAMQANDAIPLGLTGAQYLGLKDTIEQSAQNSLAATQEEAMRLIGTNSTSFSGSNGGSSEGDTHVYNGVTYKVINGRWVSQ